jgi:type I restriction enzyme, S subunit
MSKTFKPPINWRITKLINVAHLQTGIAKNSKHSKECIDIPYLRVANVQDGFVDFSEILNITVPKNIVSNYYLKKNDLLLIEGNGNPANLGRCAIWDGRIVNCIHQNHIFVVRAIQDKIDYRFLALQIQSQRGKNYLLSCAKSSSGLATLNSTQVKSFPILLPPLPEQKAIADALSTWDMAIDKTGRLIRAKEIALKVLFNELITKPCKSGKWREVRLHELCKVVKGQQLNVEFMFENGKYYALNGGISPSGRTNNWNTSEHTITISEGGNSCGFVSYNHEKFWAGGHCYTLLNVNNTRLSIRYLFYFLKNMESRIMKLRVGSGLPNIQKKDIEAIMIGIPDSKVQKDLVVALDNKIKEIDLLKQLTEKYKLLKRGLMQKLLTGEWRVKPEIINKFGDA